MIPSKEGNVLEYRERPGWWKADQQTRRSEARRRTVAVFGAAAVALTLASPAVGAPRVADPHKNPGGVGQYIPQAVGGSSLRE